MHDRLLLVLSGNSMKNDWVCTEIRRAFASEKKENRRNLFPIRVAALEEIKEWTLFDSDSGKDLTAEIRQHHIPDFTNWKEHDQFEKAFDRLLEDLRSAEK